MKYNRTETWRWMR